MPRQPATVKTPVLGGAPGSTSTGASVDDPPVVSPVAEAIRLRLADSWGEMGAAWGVAPAIARVHGYLMARGGPLTEREIREALGLSHRATSLALADSEAWGIVERLPTSRRVGRRGPAGAAFKAAGDHWRWFGRIVAERKAREGDPIVATLEATAAEATMASASDPDDADLAALAEWLRAFLSFVRLFDRALALVPRLAPRELERAFDLLGRLPDETALRLIGLMDTLDNADVLALADAMSRLSPAAARRATTLMAGVVRTLAR